MKLSHKLLTIVPIFLSFLLITLASYLYISQNSLKNPQNSQLSDNQAYLDFKQAINISQLNNQISQIEYRPYLEEIQFILQESDYPTTVIISTQKNIFQQVAALQKTLKIAKMDQQRLSFIDLSLKHPYATLKNN